MGLNIIHRDFSLLLVSNFFEEAGKAKIPPTPDLLEDQEREQKYFATSQRATLFSPRFLTVHKCPHIIELIAVTNVVYYISLQNSLFDVCTDLAIFFSHA